MSARILEAGAENVRAIPVYNLLSCSILLLVGVFTADKFNTGIFASDILIQAKLLSGVFTAGGITEWS